MATNPLCSVCGQPVAPNAPQGLCPECLLQAGLGSGVDLALESQSAGGRTPFVAPAPEELARLFPQLEILGCLGQGGMGAVYQARQKELDRVVALKILPPGIGADPAFAERFTREARALARLNHPGVVTLYEFGRANGLFFFLMEFVDGINLRQLLEAGRLSAREALAIVPQICDALQYAHDHGIVHRDIKPANILLDRQGRVKVADFGLAKLVGGAPPALTPALSPSAEEEEEVSGQDLTAAGKVMGTPQYMAPEQGQWPSHVDHRADIYSLGVVFYQMLTGELPGQRLEPPSRKVQVDVRLDEVVLRALEKDPERRYQQASQVKTDVQTIAVTSAPGAASSSAAAQPSSFQSGASGWLETARWSARLLGLALLQFVALIFGLYLFGVGVPPLALQSGGTLLNYLAITLIVLGFVVGWKLEGAAAVLIAAGWALWHGSNGSLAWSMFHLALLVAALYAFCWWTAQGRRTSVLVAAAAVLVALLVCGLLFLPANIWLFGTVLDAVTHQPIPDAELIVSHPPFPPNAPKSPATARSLPSGYYVLHVGWYTPDKQVRVTTPGYAPLQVALGPKPLGTRRISRDFALSPLSAPPPGPAMEQSLEYLLRNPWWQQQSEKIAADYSEQWLPRLSDADALLRLGFALYDTRRYSDALKVFARLEELGNPGPALVWRGHMLDLLGQRSEALAAYSKALDSLLETVRYDQYGIVLTKAYVQQRLNTPFARVGNRIAPPPDNPVPPPTSPHPPSR